MSCWRKEIQGLGRREDRDWQSVIGRRIFVFSRGKKHRELGLKLGAEWAGTIDQEPPVKIQSSIIFAPAGSMVPKAMGHLDKGGTLATAVLRIDQG